MTALDAAGFSLVDLGTVTSTNDVAMARARAGAPSRTVVRAVSQTAGRGRMGRVFESPPGNSYTSFILRPARPVAETSQLALVAGLAVAEALDGFAPAIAEARCKWPNDVLVKGCKVAGILVESSIGRGLEAVVVGIGVNLVHHPDLPDVRAASLRSLGALDVDRDRWLRVLLHRMSERVELWEKEGFTALQEAWMERAAGLGTMVTVAGQDPVRGRLKGVDGRGRLLIDQDGVMRSCVSGSLILKDAA